MRTKFLLIPFLILISQQALAGINIQHWKTENGARVYFVAAPELPIVDAQIIFDAGAARDNGKGGVALLTNALLSEGAGELSAEKISEAFDDLGAQFGSDAQRDMANLSVRTLSDDKTLWSTLELMATVLTQPTFPKDAFERERKRLLIGLQQKKQSPGALANEAFYKAVFGSHPYSVIPEGKEDSVKSITVDELKKFYQRYYVASNAVIAIVGNLDKSQAEKVANAIVAKLPAGTPAEKLPDVATLDSSKNVKVSHPSTQTHILIGQPGMRRGDPDYFSLYVGNHILGGSGLVARLSNEVREKRGLSYSTYSFFLPMRQNGPFTIGLQTRTDQVQEALDVVQQTVSDLINKGPTEKELNAAKKNITGGFPLRISSNKKIVGYIGMIGFYGLSLDYLDKFNDEINAVTIKSIKDAFQRRVKPSNMVTVLVGKET